MCRTRPYSCQVESIARDFTRSFFAPRRANRIHLEPARLQLSICKFRFSQQNR